MNISDVLPVRLNQVYSTQGRLISLGLEALRRLSISILDIISESRFGNSALFGAATSSLLLTV